MIVANREMWERNMLLDFPSALRGEVRKFGFVSAAPSADASDGQRLLQASAVDFSFGGCNCSQCM